MIYVSMEITFREFLPSCTVAHLTSLLSSSNLLLRMFPDVIPKEPRKSHAWLCTEFKRPLSPICEVRCKLFFQIQPYHPQAKKWQSKMYINCGLFRIRSLELRVEKKKIFWCMTFSLLKGEEYYIIYITIVAGIVYWDPINFIYFTFSE